MTRLRCLVTLTALLLLAGCGSAAPEPEPEQAKSLRVAIYHQPLGFDPHLFNEFITASVLSNVYQGLTRLDGALRVQPALATGWENPDALTWRFPIRRGVFFHDGSQLQAEDVVYSLRRARDHDASDVTSYLVGVSEVEAIDPYTVEIRTAKPFATLLNKLAFVAIVPRNSPERITEPVGTGPYRLGRQQPGKPVVLNAFERYWGEPAKVDRVELHPVSDDRKRVDRLLDGRVDLVQGLPTEFVDEVEASPGHRVIASESMAVTYLEMRTDEPPLADRRVRRAIDLAVDRQQLVDETLDGFGSPMGQLVTSHVVGHVPDLEPPERDLERARELLAEAGFPDGIDLELEHGEGADVDALVAQLAEAGIRVQPEPLPWEELWKRLGAGEVDFHIGGVFAESGDASDVLDEIVHSRDDTLGYGSSNAVDYSNPEIDALIEQSGGTLDTLERRRLLQECLRLVAEDLAFIPLYVPETLYAARQDLVWTPRLDGTLDLASIAVAGDR